MSEQPSSKERFPATIVGDMSRFLIVELPELSTHDERKQIAQQIASALQSPAAELAPASKELRCAKHGCVITQTITDDVFCGVCRSAELKAEIEHLQRRLDAREELVDSFEKQLGIQEADATITIGSEIERLLKERDAIEKAFREAGYTGDDLAAGVANLRALFDAERGASPPRTDFVELVSAANGGAAQAPSTWQPIETAPKDGSLILALTSKYGPLPLRWGEFGEGSIAREEWKRGKGPIGGFWWSDPIRNWTQTCEAMHWMPLPAAPGPTKGDTP